MNTKVDVAGGTFILKGAVVSSQGEANVSGKLFGFGFGAQAYIIPDGSSTINSGQSSRIMPGRGAQSLADSIRTARRYKNTNLDSTFFKFIENNN